MSINFRIHVELGNTGIVWWAETAAIPTLSVAASSLRGLRELIDEAVALHMGGDVEVHLELVAEGPDPDTDTLVRPAPEVVASEGERWSRVALVSVR